MFVDVEFTLFQVIDYVDDDDKLFELLNMFDDVEFKLQIDNIDDDDNLLNLFLMRRYEDLKLILMYQYFLLIMLLMMINGLNYYSFP